MIRIIFNKQTLVSILGNSLEFYEFTVFMFLAPMISKEFFPTDRPFISVLFTISIFATGFFMRPIGALLFGHIGDKYGRQEALAYSILLMSIPTFLIGICPNYSHIGQVAPFVILLLRLFQGVCTGGEYSGAAIYAIENNVPERSGYVGAFITSSCILGSVVGSFVSLVLSLPQMPLWSWRIAFILGAVGGVFGYFVRVQAFESHAIKKEISESSYDSSFIQSIKMNLRSFFCVLGISGFSGCITYTCFSYMNLYLITFKHWDKHVSLAITSLGMVVYMIFSPLFGHFSDKYGGKKIMISGAISTVIIIYPCFYTLSYLDSFVSTLCVQILLSISASAFQGPMNGFMSKLFTTRYRYRGMAISYSIGMALFGGTAASVLMVLSQYTNEVLSPFFYISLIALLGIGSTYFSKQTYLLRSSI